MFRQVSGFIIGCICAVIAMGFALVCKAMEAANFAQGDIVMVFPYSPCILATAVSMAIFKMVVEQSLSRPLIAEPVFLTFMRGESHLKKTIARLKNPTPESIRFHSERPWNHGPDALGGSREALAAR